MTDNMSVTLDRPIGIFVHLFYEELAEEVADYLARIDLPKTIYISTNTKEKLRLIVETFERFGLTSVSEFVIVPNLGYDIAPLLIQFSDKLSEHDICLKIHGKKSTNERVEYGERWRNYLYEELIGDAKRVRAIVRTMLANPELGVLMAQHYYGAQAFINIGQNYQTVQKILAKIHVDLVPNQRIEFPSGSMFWFRSEALARLAGLGLEWSDFDADSHQRDGTLAHGIERCFLFFSASVGKRWGFLPPYRAGPRDSREEVVHLIRASGAFDEEYYRAAYPDVRDAGVDPIQHWVDHGSGEARNPSDPRYPNPTVYNLLERHLRGAPWSDSRAIWGLAADAEIRCVKAPSFSAEVALFVTHSRDGSLKPHVLQYVESLRREGVAVVLIVNTDEPFGGDDPGLLSRVNGLFMRQNKGYDFAAWAHLIQLHREVLDAAILYLVNDSLIGPIDQTKFGNLLQRVRDSKADVVGLTESLEGGWHLQSFFLALKTRALLSSSFTKFIEAVICYEDKDDVIRNYEIRFATILKAAGLDCESIFHATDARNSTVYYWRELFDSGFPFVKAFVYYNTHPHIVDLLSARGFDVQRHHAKTS
jgi:lipopolysaccharide biosynthesis protein